RPGPARPAPAARAPPGAAPVCAAPAAAAAAAPAAVTPVAPAPVALATRRGRRGHVGEVGAGVALGHDLALVDPALHADAPECRARLVEAVVDVGAHRVQRDAPVGVAFGARHLGPAEAPGDPHLDALRA